MKVIRQFDVFNKLTEELTEEIPISEFNLDEVKLILNSSEDDPELYYQYKVEKELKRYFEELGFIFNLDKYDYFLACYQDK